MDITKKSIEECVIDGVTDSGIRKTDEMKGLENFCSDNPPLNDFEKKIRGYVFSGQTLILKSFPYADVYSNEDIDISKFSVTTMVEGTSIRVFYYNNEWFITTHRKLNAYKSKWGRISFGEIFETNILKKTGKTVKNFLETCLDKKFTYIFLVGATDITRVVAPAYSDVILLAVLDKNNNVVQCTNLPWYLPKHKFLNLKDAVKFVQSEFSYPFSSGHGLFLFSADQCFKIINKEYESLASLRNNLPSIPFAYLHNIFDYEKRKKFREIYSTFLKDFDFYDSEVEKISQNLLDQYIRRYVFKEKFLVSKYENNILYHIHGLFLKEETVIKKEQVLKALTLVPPSNINKIINERKLAVCK